MGLCLFMSAPLSQQIVFLQIIGEQCPTLWTTAGQKSSTSDLSLNTNSIRFITNKYLRTSIHGHLPFHLKSAAQVPPSTVHRKWTAPSIGHQNQIPTMHSIVPMKQTQTMPFIERRKPRVRKIFCQGLENRFRSCSSLSSPHPIQNFWIHWGDIRWSIFASILILQG